LYDALVNQLFVYILFDPLKFVKHAFSTISFITCSLIVSEVIFIVSYIWARRTVITSANMQFRAIIYNSDSQHGPGEPQVVNLELLVVHKEFHKSTSKSSW